MSNQITTKQTKDKGQSRKTYTRAINNPTGLKLALAIKTIKDISEEDLEDFTGITRQTLGNHYRKQEAK